MQKICGTGELPCGVLRTTLKDSGIQVSRVLLHASPFLGTASSSPFSLDFVM